MSKEESPGADGDPEAVPAPWACHARRRGESMILFRPRYDALEHPRSRAVMERLVLETPGWCNVLALTPARELVLVRQFRFGLGRLTLEIPGGMVDRGEEHGAAARRELLEETGFGGGSWSYLGAVEPNPAFHDNLLHTWLAEGVERQAQPSLDPGEDIQVLTLGLADVAQRVASGEIRHSLVICALARLIDLRSGPAAAPWKEVAPGPRPPSD